MATFDEMSHPTDWLLDRQRNSWLHGERLSIEELLRGTPFENDREAQLDLVYNEIVVQEELGLSVAADDYLSRYPHLRGDLALHFEVHRAISDQVLVDTNGPQDEESWPALPAAAPDVPVPPSRYEIVRPLGEGAMAAVYLARDRRLRRDVALKVFQPGRLLRTRDLFRIRTEAEATARLAHPNIIQIFEIGESHGVPFLAVELASQGTLAQKLQQLPFTPRAAATLILTLARALQHAHERQVIHRDLKPANVLFTGDGTPKISDFGLAKVVEDRDLDSAEATRTGEALGTPRYMAPEQASGRNDEVGPTTDVYGLGTLLYECLTGRAPFVSASVAETLQRIRSEDPLPPRRLQTSVARDLETICLHCLEKDPLRRYASAADLADDLLLFLNGEPIHARPISVSEKTWKWCRRQPARAALIAIGLVTLFGGATAGAAAARLEGRRIAGLRSEIATLMAAGRAALDADEPQIAQARFQTAWMKVQSEPALSDHETSVSGWLDHARNAANRYQWKQRIPPREYDERRDEAFVQSLLVIPCIDHAIATARESIADALQFTLPGEPAWQAEREQLTLLDAELIVLESGPAAALAHLDATNEPLSSCFHLRRAELLAALGRNAEAGAARAAADLHPIRPSTDRFRSGMALIRRREFVEAEQVFDRVLNAEPEHFAARLFQAICFLQLGRPGEAKVALTACIAQRPRFHWNYYFRGQAAFALGDATSARADLEQALEGRPGAIVELATRDELTRLQRMPDRPKQAHPSADTSSSRP